MELRISSTVFLIVTIGCVWLQTAYAQQGQLSPGQMFPAGHMCPDRACTLEFIPEECREFPTIQINGNNCLGCQRWKSSCDRTTGMAFSTCPVLACPTLIVPRECQVVEPYEYNGRKCSSCPKIRTECVGANAVTITCPPQACPLILIPTECSEVSTFNYMGQTCDGCPQWKQGCVPGQTAMPTVLQPRPTPKSQPEVSCPMVACDSYVPAECKVTSEFQFSGRTCQGCPTWRQGCREPERRAAVANPSIGRSFPAAPVSCPVFPCPSVQVPEQCLEQQPYEYQGKTCYRCPRVKEGCTQGNIFSNGIQNIFPDRPCPLIRCQALNVPAYCLKQEVYQINGRMCQKCPTVKPECQVLASQTPLTAQQIQTQLEAQCPDRRCPLIRIPTECMEIEKFQFEGKTCDGCPRFKAGCVPLSNREIPSNPTINENVLSPVTEVKTECPMVGCPFIYIPSECKEEQPYQFQGQTCYGCPKRRDNCIANPINTDNGNTNPMNVPEAECPLLACNRMLIPLECREVQSYEFQGRTCYSCPRFRKGCVPGSGSNGLLITDRLANVTSAKPVVKPLDIAPPATPQIACPLISCDNSHLPQECLEPQTYKLMDKTCNSCPKTKLGCVNIQDSKKVCPEPNCPVINIPPECIEVTTYNVNGVACPKCPRRREGCRGQNEISQRQLEGNRLGNIPCPLVDCTQQMEDIPMECREEVTYMHLGAIRCNGCPIWRHGCVPNSIPPNRRSQSQNPGQIEFSGSDRNPGSSGTSGDSLTRLEQVDTPATSITNFRGVIPVERFMSAVQASLCPRLPCPAVEIPAECREESSYMYNGISCPGCPTWKGSCRTGTAGRPNLNMNGILAYSFFNEMMTRR